MHSLTSNALPVSNNYGTKLTATSLPLGGLSRSAPPTHLVPRLDSTRHTVLSVGSNSGPGIEIIFAVLSLCSHQSNHSRHHLMIHCYLDFFMPHSTGLFYFMLCPPQVVLPYCNRSWNHRLQKQTVYRTQVARMWVSEVLGGYFQIDGTTRFQLPPRTSRKSCTSVEPTILRCLQIGSKASYNVYSQSGWVSFSYSYLLGLYEQRGGYNILYICAKNEPLK